MFTNQEAIFKSLFLLANLLILNAAPSLPTFQRSQQSGDKVETATRTIFVVEPQEEFYASQYLPASGPVGLPREVSRFDENPTPAKTPLQKNRRGQEAITSSAELSNSGGSTSFNNEQDGEKREDSFVINPIPSTQFILPPKDSVVPKIIGSYVKDDDNNKGASEPSFSGPISNPAAYYLAGSNIEDVKPPKCQLMGCDGPVPNDGDFFLDQTNDQKNSACHQTFVPLNSCVDNRGYPIGMVCTICCDCSADLIKEMRKSRGYLQGYKAK